MNIKELPEDKFNDIIMSFQIEAAKRIAAANGKIDEIQNAIYDYVNLGYASGLAAEEIVDFFCVSSDSVVDRIDGLIDSDREFIIYIFDRINCTLFQKYFPENRLTRR